MTDTGGPAFPTESAHQSGPSLYHFEGMTLRDYFAAKALQGLISGCGLVAGTDTTRVENTAYQAYQFADAMLAARLEPQHDGEKK